MVEDNVANASVQRTILELAGATVGYERWGTDSIPAIEDFLPVDIIMLDLHFRATTGYEILKQIRASPELDGIPVVAVSASDASIEMSKARRAGFNGFISKPIDLSSFTKQVKEIINGGDVWYAR
ncbi:MAG: response regulator [Chloroflexota bacterium]